MLEPFFRFGIVRSRQKKASGDPGKIRTSDTQFRKLLLYPPELRGHRNHLRSLTQIPEITAPHSLHPQTVQNSLFSGVWAPDENDAITINRVASQQVSQRTLQSRATAILDKKNVLFK
jgi:hypothetical protein